MNFQPYAISQSQMISTYAPEQILRGKVLDLLPDRTALVQLGAKQVVAKVASVEPPLKVGQDYLFQIQQGSNPLLAKVVDRKQTTDLTGKTMVDDVLTALNLDNNDSVTRKIIQSFLNHGDPLSRDTILGARALMKAGSEFSKDMQTIRWLLNRELPLTNTFFQIAKDSARMESLSTKLEGMLQQLDQAPVHTSAMDQLKTSLHTFSNSNGSDRLLELFNQIGRERGRSLLSTFIKEQMPESQLTRTIQSTLDRYMSGSFTNKETSALMKDLNLGGSVQSFSESFRDFAVQHDPEVSKLLKIPSEPDTLFQALKKIGFDYEHQLTKWFNNGVMSDQLSSSIKEQLLAVAQDPQSPSAIKKAAHDMVQKITGEQLQMVSADPFVAQFSMQLPLPFQQKVSNVSIYWEGKRDRKGTLDPNSCTLLLWLDLNHLKETLISVRVQNRSVALTIQNDQMDLSHWLKAGEMHLSERLKEIGYQLVSLTQSEKIDPNLIKKATQPLTESNYRLDVKV
ncbi:hypothetical protein ACFP7A_02765 [Sporolactobacillus kofuensis]|uniref:Flagellar hook-length control protein-like C-terminal domain-containing protein n=1 Tax=Sporolactobacillus kofuensis TaxID=269672 RepID=A0ABW1WD41_9BACL|nr:hypothetical protein [Sporolactobacillus kofuensis]MCO7174678.1 hypothetical protein [Sporolactobacillus kofuensis]